MDYISTPGLDYGLYLHLDWTMDYLSTPGLDNGLYLGLDWTMDYIYAWTGLWTVSTPGLDY